MARGITFRCSPLARTFALFIDNGCPEDQWSCRTSIRGVLIYTVTDTVTKAPEDDLDRRRLDEAVVNKLKEAYMELFSIPMTAIAVDDRDPEYIVAMKFATIAEAEAAKALLGTAATREKINSAANAGGLYWFRAPFISGPGVAPDTSDPSGGGTSCHLEAFAQALSKQATAVPLSKCAATVGSLAVADAVCVLPLPRNPAVTSASTRTTLSAMTEVRVRTTLLACSPRTAATAGHAFLESLLGTTLSSPYLLKHPSALPVLGWLGG